MKRKQNKTKKNGHPLKKSDRSKKLSFENSAIESLYLQLPQHFTQGSETGKADTLRKA